MTTDKTLRFRPAVVVCVGEQGRKVGAQLDTLLAEWVEQEDPRRAGVALIEVDEHPGAFADSADADGTSDRLVGGWMQSRLDAERATGTPRRAGDVPLSRLIVEALRGRPGDEDDPARAGVLDDQAVWRIEEAGYVVPRAMAVVWVVASACSPLLEAATREVRRGLESERVDNWVLLALPNAYPRDPEQHAEQARLCAEQHWDRLLVGEGGGAPLATYAYVFETQSERGTFWEGEDDVAFAAAEAIFVLTASGITTTREYEDMLRRSLPSMVGSPYERMSGVGTSRLLFPRAYVEQYCASELGAELMRVWARSEEMEVAPVAATAQKAAARTVLTKLRSQTSDSQSLARGGRPSPRVSFEGISRTRPMPRPVPDGGLIFSHFSQGELDRLADGRRDTPTRLAQQREKAEEGFAIWSQTIRPAWERAERTIDRALTATAGEMVLEGAGGVARARTYLDEVRSLLVTERERMARQREARAIAYERFLRRMELAGEGPWLMEPAPQPQPVMQPAPVRVVPQSAPVAPAMIPPRVPVYQTYPPTPGFATSAPRAYAPGDTSPVPGFSPVLAPGLATSAAPNVSSVGYAPAGLVPIVPILTMSNVDWSGPWRWDAARDTQSSGAWRLMNNTSGALGAGFDASAYGPRYAAGVSAPYAPPATDPASRPVTLIPPDAREQNPSSPAYPMYPSYPPNASYPPNQSYPLYPSESGPIATPASPTVQSRPMNPASSGPVSFDPPTNPSGVHAVPPISAPISSPISPQASRGGPIAAELQAPPLPSYLAPAPPAYQSSGPVPVVVPAEPPSREEQLIAKLTTRVRYYEARRPSVAALLGISLAALPPLVFLAQAVTPHTWLDRPFGLLYLTGALALLVAALATGYALLRTRELRDAVEDLRDVYRRSFANRCEQHEDVRREAVVAGLLAHVRRMVDRLGQWDTFAATMAETMEAEAAAVDHNLFEGAIGRRNVLVANRRRLHPMSYRLANLEVDVSTKRRRRPIEGFAWHSDLSAMLPRLRNSLRGGKSLLEADPSELVVPIRTFCAGIVRPYLTGEIADLSAAFETLPQSESTTYFDALMARSAILYRPADPPTGAISFVAAHDEHQGYVSGKRQRAEPITLPIEDRGWLGVLRLFPGGSLPTFRLPDDAQLKPALSEPLWESGEMPAVMATGRASWDASRVAGPMGARAPQTQVRAGRPSTARQSVAAASEDGWLLDDAARAAHSTGRGYSR